MARGSLYDFHLRTGSADRALGRAVEALRAGGAHELAESAQRESVGRDVIADRWTFQIVEDYDPNSWSPVRDFDQHVRSESAGGRRQVPEARMKEQRRTAGLRHHQAAPED